ncbi:MAG: hypothetical protein WA173_18680 [Pseudomonas sp.]|uniref:hypothetical protein n=1 Tax=Pseudomonas sp. TaxID=306 RepID=UPI003BB750DD
MTMKRSGSEQKVPRQRSSEGRLALSQYKARMLLEALLLEFPSLVVTGYLVDARIACECAQGLVYKGWGRRNGEFITTGQIVEILQYDGRWLLNTIDMDWLVVVNFHPRGGRRSLTFLVDLLQSAALAGSEYCWH